MDIYILTNRHRISPSQMGNTPIALTVQYGNVRKPAFICETYEFSTINNELYRILLKQKYQFKPALAHVHTDGRSELACTQCAIVPVTVDGRMTVMRLFVTPEWFQPSQQINRLGIDFLKCAGITIDANRQCLFYSNMSSSLSVGFKDEVTTKFRLDSIHLSLRLNEATDWTATNRSILFKMLRDELALFNDGGPPSPRMRHYIPTEDLRPITNPAVHLSANKVAVLESQLDLMERKGIIRRHNSKWAAPALIIAIAKNTFQVQVDFRQINAITKPITIPLPQIHNADVVMPYISAIDLDAGYSQISIDEIDREKTSFNTPFGTFHYITMPIGLRNAQVTFQEYIEIFRKALPHISISAYVDGLVVRSKSLLKHLMDLHEVFRLLNMYGFRAIRERCHFGVKTFPHLDHLITQHGIVPNPAKTEVLLYWARPSDLEQLHDFLPACWRYGSCIPNFADVCRPLTQLTEKDAAWVWTEPQQQSFDQLKLYLTTSPIIIHANGKKPFVVKTGVSAYAIGAVLLQGAEESEHPIQYASRMLTSDEQSLKTTDLKATAIVWACQTFRAYIEGRTTNVYTDELSLKYLMQLKAATGPLIHRVMQLQAFEIQIIYSTSYNNAVANTLANPPCIQRKARCAKADSLLIDNVSGRPLRNNTKLRALQNIDQETRAIIQALEDTTDDEKGKRYSNDGFILKDGALFYCPFADVDEGEADKIYVPERARREVFNFFHNDVEHFGFEDTMNRIYNQYYWPGMQSFIQHRLSKCLLCLRYENLLLESEFLRTSVLGRSKVLHIILIDNWPRNTVDRYLLLVADENCQGIGLFLIKFDDTRDFTMALLNEVISKYGNPLTIHTDYSNPILSDMVRDLQRYLEINISYAPRNALNYLKCAIECFIKIVGSSWTDHLPALCFALNILPIPVEAVLAAHINICRDNCDDVTAVLRQYDELYTHTVFQQADTLRKLYEASLDQPNEAKDYTLPHLTYLAGFHVWVGVHTDGVGNSTDPLEPQKRTGPYIVMSRYGSVNYELASPDDPTKSVGIYHKSTILGVKRPLPPLSEDPQNSKWSKINSAPLRRTVWEREISQRVQKPNHQTLPNVSTETDTPVLPIVDRPPNVITQN